MPSTFVVRNGDDANLTALTLSGALVAGAGVQSPIATYGVNGAIAIPSGSTNAFLTKAGVGVMTLASPTAVVHDGITLTIISTTAQAHTVTVTAGFNGGGASSDVATFGGAIGDGLVVTAYNGVWYVVSLRNVTLG